MVAGHPKDLDSPSSPRRRPATRALVTVARHPKDLDRTPPVSIHRYAQHEVMTHYQYITTSDSLARIAQSLSSAETIALDLETTGFSPLDARTRLLSLNVNGRIVVIDCFQTHGLHSLIPAMRAYKGVWIGQNLKFDQRFLLHEFDIELGRMFDTFRASSLIYNGRLALRHDLWALYERELGIRPTVMDLGGSDWTGVLSKEQLDYAADDVEKLPALRHVLRQKLVELGLVQVAKIEFAAILPEAAIELAGFYLDSPSWIQLADENAVQESIYRHQLLKALPHPKGQGTLPGFDTNINLQSPKQMLESLLQLGLPITDTNEASLAMVSDEYPIVETILKYREYAQCLKSFGAPYLDANISKVTGRIHTSFFPFTGCGRYSSSKPNLTQIPRRKEFRACFKAPPGKKLVICDFSQVELRVAAELSGDTKLMGVYQRAEDAHAQTAALVSGCALGDVTKAQRNAAKAINFGLIYGMGFKKLPVYSKKGYGVTMTLAEAEKYHTRYFDAYRGVAAWHRKILSKGARAKGITRTIAGRLRYLPEDFYNEYANTPVQGTGADGLKASLRTVYERLRKYHDSARMVNMIHDEIVVECDIADVAAVSVDLKEGMEEAMQQFLKRVPIVAEVSSGPSWAEK